MGLVTPQQNQPNDTIEASDINTPVNQLAAVLNGSVDSTNLASSAVATVNIADNAVTASKLATNALTLGYAQITADVNTASSTYVQVTGLTLTVTIPSGSRQIRITAKCGSAYNGTNADGVGISIWDGTVGSGTQLDASEGISAVANNTHSLSPVAIVTPSAGSKTYNIGIKAITGGTAHTNSQTTVPSFILVEAI